MKLVFVYMVVIVCVLACICYTIMVFRLLYMSPLHVAIEAVYNTR